MRGVITNFGSAGDVHPYLALIMEMNRRGHQIAFAFSPHFGPWIERYGVEFIPIGPNFEQMQYDIITTVVSTPNIDNSAGHMYSLFGPLVAALPQMYQELNEACRNADVLISGPLQPASRVIHELTGIPFVSIQEAHFGGGGTPAYQQATTALINPFRAQYKLPSLRHPLTHDANSPQLALYAISRHVLPPPPDWPRHYHMTGYFFFDDESFEPDPRLVEFLAAGEPPIVISFGSMTHDDPQAVTDLLLRAVEIVGCRAIIQQGWSGLGGRAVPPHVYIAPFIPHAWLFPRVSCVVHHGGPGTVAATFRAGVPSIFVPHTFDQPIWASLAYDLGTVPPIPILELTADRLATAINLTITDPHYRRVAGELRAKIQSEDGVETAAELIEKLVYRIGLYEEENVHSAKAVEEEPDEDGAKGSRRKHYQRQQRQRRGDAG